MTTVGLRKGTGTAPLITAWRREGGESVFAYSECSVLTNLDVVVINIANERKNEGSPR